MKLLLKILAAPVIVVLTVFVWVCVLILHISALILGLAGTVVALLGLAALLFLLQYVKGPCKIPPFSHDY